MMSNSDTIMLYASMLYRGREVRENNILFRVNIYISQENINLSPINPLTPYSPPPPKQSSSKIPLPFFAGYYLIAKGKNQNFANQHEQKQNSNTKQQGCARG